MRLEHAPQSLMGIVCSGFERGGDLRRVVRVVVKDPDACDFALEFEASVRSGKGGQGAAHDLRVKAKDIHQGDDGQGVQDIVFAHDAESDRAAFPAFSDKGVGGAPKLIVDSVRKAVVGGGVRAEGDDIAAESPDKLFDMIDPAVDDQKAVSGKDLGKSSEGMADIVDVFEEVHMILLDVEDDADARKKAQKGVGVLAGFRHKIVGPADADISPDGFQDPADGQGGVGIRSQKHF